ncbi:MULTISPECIES: hypothetical protein [Massilia]|jgi:hypothetical protein|uniref:DUF7167 family protein n=1 Tax=Massilia TaxID=149698 RepID=UPI0004E33F50|nr:MULTISPECIES: hypothetical protein [Massilia]KFC73310.1 hypothetical protein FG94_01589 [Massilia sp. LC238]
MSDKIKIRVAISTQKINSECVVELEFDRAEWEGMTDKEKDDACREAAFSMMEWYWNEV